jgi:hypothetical protein
VEDGREALRVMAAARSFFSNNVKVYLTQLAELKMKAVDPVTGGQKGALGEEVASNLLPP